MQLSVSLLRKLARFTTHPFVQLLPSQKKAIHDVEVLNVYHLGPALYMTRTVSSSIQQRPSSNTLFP